MKLAAIDIGSNAARLLINEVKETADGQPEFTKLNLLRIPLRLGMDVFSKGEIGPERQEMVISTMKVFADLMKIYGVEHYRACATSAMRDAKNGSLIREIVEETSGIKIEIISGDEEASLIYNNHAEETLDANFSYLYIDVGGGSTELMHFQGGKMKYKRSFNIGTIRLLNGLVEDEHWDEIKNEIKNKIVGKKEIIGIGSGGNINKIFSMSKTKDGKPLTLLTLKKYLKEFSDLTLEERMHRYGLREDRADVLVPALEIFTRVMNWAGMSKILVPKISVADGLIHNIYEKVSQQQEQTDKQ